MAAITASSLLWYDVTTFSLLDLGIFSRDVRLGTCPALAWPLNHIYRVVRKPLLRCLGCVLRVIVLLEWEPSAQSEVLSALEQVFIKDIFVLCSVQPSLNPSHSLALKNTPTT